MKTEIAKAIALLTAEYDLPAFSPDRIAMWMNALSGFPRGSVTKSVENHMRTNRFKPQLVDIVTGCQAQVGGGWLGADEAWSRVPKSESESTMLTNEIAQALAVASPLLAEGETNAARMAFRSTYNRLIEQAKIDGRQPRYFLSQGTDEGGRVSALAQGIRAGQIGLDAAMVLLPAAASELISAAGVTHHPLLAGPSAAGRQKLAHLMTTLAPREVSHDEC